MPRLGPFVRGERGSTRPTVSVGTVAKKNDGPTTKADRREAKKRFQREPSSFPPHSTASSSTARPRDRELAPSTHTHTRTHTTETMPAARVRPAKPRAARRRAPFALLFAAAVSASALSLAEAASASYDPAKCTDKDVVAPLGLACQTAMADSSSMPTCCAALTTWNAAGCNCPAHQGKTLLDLDEYAAFKPALSGLNAGCGIDAADDDADDMCIPPSPPPAPNPPTDDASTKIVEDAAAGASAASAASLAAAVAAAFVATALVAA